MSTRPCRSDGAGTATLYLRLQDNDVGDSYRVVAVGGMANDLRVRFFEGQGQRDITDLVVGRSYDRYLDEDQKP